MHVKPHRVVLFWHMHQPDYRNGGGIYQQPWTYLHAIKDYTDMAAHLECAQKVRAVVNFTPVLLDQINDYLVNIDAYLSRKHSDTCPVQELVQSLKDPLLSALVTPSLNTDVDYQLGLIESCLKVHPQHAIERYSAYSSLASFAQELLKHPQRIPYVREAFISDLLMWYHLVWMGETIKLEDFRFMRFVDQGNNFSLQQRKELLMMIRDHLASIIPRYRALAESGKVELSMTPYAHPIAPLLFDLHSASQAIPDISLPESTHYPGGEQRMAWHIEQGLAVFEKNFNRRPVGCWPAEGAIDESTLRLLDDYDFQWAASGGTVLRHSLAPSLHSIGQVPHAKLHYLYQPENRNTACFFRNDELSDLIGFTYSSWHADDAVADLVQRLENIAKQFADDSEACTVIALDGENAWEYFPNNGLYFLRALYKRLGGHRKLQLTTFSELLSEVEKPKRENLPNIVAGSWVHGTLRTWIGNQDKNRAWDMLVDAKLCVDRELSRGNLNHDQIQAVQYKLAVCEGSDWFWWFGDDNPMQTSLEFDRLFRLQLMSLYKLLEQPSPDYLAEPFTHLHASADLPLGGTMRKAE